MRKQRTIIPNSVLVVQVITTWWTKYSRGGQAAVVRNSVPEQLPLPLHQIPNRNYKVLLHRVVFNESCGFAIPIEQIKPDPSVYPGTGSTAVGRSPAEAWAKYEYGLGAPLRTGLKGFLTAPVGEWVRVRENGRFPPPWEGHWQYRKVVVNVGLFIEPTEDVFTRKSPRETFQAMADLW